MLLFLQSLVNGILLGGIYAAYSAGFSLIFGVMGVVNLFHGEMVMLGAFLKRTRVIILGSVLQALRQVLPTSRSSLLQLNEKALLRGADACPGLPGRYEHSCDGPRFSF